MKKTIGTLGLKWGRDYTIPSACKVSTVPVPDSDITERIAYQALVRFTATAKMEAVEEMLATPSAQSELLNSAMVMCDSTVVVSRMDASPVVTFTATTTDSFMCKTADDLAAAAKKSSRRGSKKLKRKAAVTTHEL